MKTYIVVGGSRGIGAALVRQLSEKGRVINISRNAPEFSSENLTHYSLDVLKDDLPKIEVCDGLVYCPGTINLKPFTRLTIEEFREDFELNVIGAIKTIQNYIPALKSGQDPSVVLFSTVATKLGMPFHTSIAASKAAIEGLTKSLGAELAPTIRINAIAPTVTNTELASNLLRNDKMIERMKERHPMKKFLEPVEVAEMANYLLSDKSTAISGQIFEMDYGIVTFKL